MNATDMIIPLLWDIERGYEMARNPERDAVSALYTEYMGIADYPCTRSMPVYGRGRNSTYDIRTLAGVSRTKVFPPCLHVRTPHGTRLLDLRDAVLAEDLR